MSKFWGSQRAVSVTYIPTFARCDFVAETNQTNMTDYVILGSSLVLVGCLAKRKQTIYGRL